VLEQIDGIEFVRFGGEDVVRHKLVQRIVEAYETHTERGGAKRSEVETIAGEGGARPAIRSA